MVKGTDHQTSCAEAKKMKLLALHTHGCALELA